MIKRSLLLIIILSSLLSIALVNSEHALPDWIRETTYPIRSYHNINETQLYGNGGFYVYAYYKPIAKYVDVYDEAGSLMPEIVVLQRVDPIAGVLYFYNNIPYIHTKITVIEEEGYKNSYDLTPLCLTHIDPNDYEHLYLRVHVDKEFAEVAQTENVNFYIEWLHVIYNKTSGEYTVIKQGYLWANFHYEDINDYYNAYTLDITLYPQFFSQTVDDTKQMIFGFNFTFTLMAYGNVNSTTYSGFLSSTSGSDPILGNYYGVTGKGYFAWGTYVISNDTSIADFKNNLKKILGWYTWIGVGIKYYIPYNSEFDIMKSSIIINSTDVSDLKAILNATSLESYSVYTGSYPIYKVYGSLVKTNDYRADSMKLKVIVRDIKTFNEIIDNDVLYYYFANDLLMEYKNATISYERFGGNNQASTLVDMLVVSTPFIAIYSFGLTIKRKELFPIGFLVGAVLGFVIGLFTVIDLVVVSITFITYILLTIKMNRGVET